MNTDALIAKTCQAPPPRRSESEQLAQAIAIENIRLRAENAKLREQIQRGAAQ